MALATQCPHCYTSFRVANDQLKLHAGMVRCGACQLTFNGIEHLLAPGEAPRTAPALQKPEAPDETQSVSSDLKVETNAPEELPHTTAEPTVIASELDTSFEESSSVDNNLEPAQSTEASIPKEQNQEPIIASTEVASATPNHDVSANSNSTSDIAPDVDFSSSSTSHEDIDLQQTLPVDSSINVNANADDETAIADEKTDTLDITEDDIDAFDQMFKITASSEQSANDHVVIDIAATVAPTEVPTESAQANLIKQFSAHLETIEPELGVQPEKETPKRQAPPLTGKLEFELTSEEQALVEQAELLHQLELENRAAILDEDAKEWSRHEPSFDEKMSLESFTPDPNTVEDPLFPNKTTSPQRIKESPDSLTEQDVSHSGDTDDTDVTPGFVLLAEKKRRYGKWQTFGWSLSCLILLMAIVLQSTYFFRSAIAAEWPATKPHLLRACQLLACQIKLPAQRQMLELAGSELLILNEELRINTLAFQIQNKSNTAQEWPALELTLKDLRGKTVLQKVFQPTEYLNNKADLTKGIAARSESNHKLHFELNTIKASNYEVGIFYP
nr:DUF3426 domain-containing protein [uncultured Undibacterium sp.]